MFFGDLGKRAPLANETVVEFLSKKFIIDRFLGAGGFSLAYVAHEEGASNYVVLKELFPQRVERGIAERRDDGKIVIYDPTMEGPCTEHPDAWNEVLPFLSHEAQMTKKAAEIFRPDGTRDTQNNPEVFGVEGPLQGKNGNYYLVVNTVQGEPLSQMIRDGFVKDEEGKIIANGNLTEILEILIKLAQSLSRLHSDNQLLHLDLSPENVYVTRVAGGTDPVPVLIDYGSAYDKTGHLEKGGHQYTFNPYSSPEIMALASINDEDAGYSPDDSSDTYSVVSILYYALTGKVFSTQTLFNPSWKKSFFDEYYYSDTMDGAERPFASLLVSFFEKGLASGQKHRFRNANDLCRALKGLRRAYDKTGTLLNRLERDELISYTVLDKYPLYEYKSADGDLNVLCLGSGVFVRRMILNMLSCGQILDGKLRIHVVSNEYPTAIKDALKSAAPMLESYSDIDRADIPEDRQYVSFSFEYVPDLLDPAQCKTIAGRYACCRYMIISLGRNSANFELAKLYADALSQVQPDDTAKTIVLFYDAEDAAANVRGKSLGAEAANNIKLAAFGEKLGSCAAGIRSLGRRALRLSYLYDLIFDPRHSIEQSARAFMSDLYRQRSNCAAVLHEKYKLASLGINPAPSTNRRAIVAAYLRALKTGKRNELLYLEHRRWLMFMIADGYCLPSIQRIDEYSFKGENASFKDTRKKLHPCLVTSGREGIVLASLPHTEWDKYQSYAEIDAADYDELDKTSLKLHLLARQKMTESRLLDDMKDGIGGTLERWIKYQAEEEKTPETDERDWALSSQRRKEQLQQKYEEVYCSLVSLLQSGKYAGEEEQLNQLEAQFREAGIDASTEFSLVRSDLKVFIEFSLYRDYKAPDAVVVDHLLWLMYAREDLVMIKVNSRSVLDNVIGVLHMRPAELLFWGKPLTEREEITTFLRLHGNAGKVSFLPEEANHLDQLTAALDAIVRRAGNRKCVIDITGGDPLFVAASVILATKNEKIGVIRYNESSGEIENVQNFYEAGIYNLKTQLSAEEVYSLFGAATEKLSPSYMRELSEITPKLWTFYREFQRDWEMITAFFFSRGQGSPELKLKFSSQTEDQYYSCVELVDRYCWNDLKTDECFQKMVSMGFIRNLSVTPRGSRLAVSFQVPITIKKGAFDTFFRDKIYYSKASPFAFECGEGKDGSTFVSLQSGYYVDIFDRSGDDFSDKRQQNERERKRYPYEAVIPALTWLEEAGLLYNLKYDPAYPCGVDQTAVKLSFVYTDLAVQRCLMIAGNILELLAWNEAYQTGYFDDCRSNFSFKWKEGIRNELDLILTRGLNTLVISCKTAKFKKEHLYEIKYLTEKFSLNSTPVIIYSSDKMVGDDGYLSDDVSPIKARARAMGVYLIDMNEIAPEDLGQVLVKISKGEYCL